jgi:hypothetical protein
MLEGRPHVGVRRREERVERPDETGDVREVGDKTQVPQEVVRRLERGSFKGDRVDIGPEMGARLKRPEKQPGMLARARCCEAPEEERLGFGLGTQKADVSTRAVRPGRAPAVNAPSKPGRPSREC